METDEGELVVVFPLGSTVRYPPSVSEVFHVMFVGWSHPASSRRAPTTCNAHPHPSTSSATQAVRKLRADDTRRIECANINRKRHYTCIEGDEWDPAAQPPAKRDPAAVLAAAEALHKRRNDYTQANHAKDRKPFSRGLYAIRDTAAGVKVSLEAGST